MLTQSSRWKVDSRRMTEEDAPGVSLRLRLRVAPKSMMGVHGGIVPQKSHEAQQTTVSIHLLSGWKTTKNSILQLIPMEDGWLRGVKREMKAKGKVECRPGLELTSEHT